MCGVAGILDLRQEPVPQLRGKLEVMNDLQQHRGPDGVGVWTHPRQHVGFGHRRLSIIDLADGAQPMQDAAGNWLVFNGEIYNYLELRAELGAQNFRTGSDTETILHAYRRWGENCVDHLRGMFAFALWDEKSQTLFCARDRFGVKPFYFTQVASVFHFASEAKALLPFLPQIETDPAGLTDYLTFQLCLHGKTLFKGIQELLPGHVLTVRHGQVLVRRYWDVYYHLDLDHTEKFFTERLTQLLTDSVDVHKRSDVPVGGYVSGGLDSSGLACLATRGGGGDFEGFVGKFAGGPRFDESRYARAVAEQQGFPLHEIEMSAADFIAHIGRVIYHLDYPVAGPGSFPQYMVSQLAAGRRKVVLGGQGADEIFGGYARYLIAYFEKCIRDAIDGTPADGSHLVTYQSIIPNLRTLREYKPLLQEFWREGLFESMERRYFRLISRTSTLSREIRWDQLQGYSPFESFTDIFCAENVGVESYFGRMTHFDLKTLLPALLHVEDRVSMAHGVESRVPFLDHPLVEFAATLPDVVKFRNGETKHILRLALDPYNPSTVQRRKDKMGFPVPLTDWVQGSAREFVQDVLSTQKALGREFVDNRLVLDELGKESQYSRKIWGLLCLELWQQEFHDQQAKFRSLDPSAGSGTVPQAA